MQQPNTYSNTLKEIARSLLTSEDDFLEMTNTIEQWKEILYSITQLDLEAEDHRANIHSESGKAIGTTWAAMCLDDVKRTKKFIKGVFKAVQDLDNQTTKRPIEILYAGCGPFAPLVLLLTTKYTPEDIQFTLLEINENSYSMVKKVLKSLELDDFLKAIHLCDATKVVLPEASGFDIVISETMQHALVREQQVPITFNMLNQLRDDVILIPEKIKLTLGMLSGKRNHALMMEGKYTSDYYHSLGPLFELSRQQFIDNKALYLSSNGVMRFPETTFALPDEIVSIFDELTVFTKIEIYKDIQLDVNECPLTGPHRLIKIQPGEWSSVRLNYKVDAVPGFEYKLTPCE